jgi:formylglycine-generating enzyme required for sulfatase activity
VAMRFLPGGSLADHRKKDASGAHQSMPAGMLHFWLPAIAEALDFIHSRGVVHRDVKPANIFFDGFWWAFLGDFGIAKVFDTTAGLEMGETLTGTQFAVGTPEYMPPEMLMSKAKPDGRADQYALAVSVYEMLAGVRPFRGQNANIVVEHATMPVPPLDYELLRLPASTVAAVVRGLSKKPEDRFGSCVEFYRAVLADVTPQPNTPGVVRLLCPQCHRILRVPQSAGGCGGTCPTCKTAVEISTDFSALWRVEEAGEVNAEIPPDCESASQRVSFELAGSSEPEENAAGPPPSSTSVPLSPEGGAVREHASGSKVRWLAVTGVVATVTLVSTALAAGIASWRWSHYHVEALAAITTTRENEKMSHAVVLADAREAQMAAVAAAKDATRAQASDSMVFLSEQLSAAEEIRDAVETQLQRTREQTAVVTKERNLLAAQVLFPDVPVNSIGIELRLIPAGTFSMGSAHGDAGEQPVHQVTISSPYYLGVTEVTNAQWKAVMRSTPSRWQSDSHPTEQVTWGEAVAFCEALSALPAERQAGRVYRLPTEAEWEYACRAGTTTAYSFGDDESLLGDFAWFGDNARSQTTAVGQKKPNAWGLYDMHGNVWEWCSDWYGDYGAAASIDPQGPAQGTVRVLRGGGWDFTAGDCRAARRFGVVPSKTFSNLGFRLALSPSGAGAVAGE